MLKFDHNYWFRIAEEDWVGIRNESLAPTKVWRHVVFFAQSASEKYLKGFLAFHGQEPERVHDMGRLLKACRSIDDSLDEIELDCYHLSFFSVDSRYPEFEGEYDEDSASRAVAAAERIKEAIILRVG